MQGLPFFLHVHVYITEPSLKALLHELHSVRASWYNIGLELDIPHTELDCFEQCHPDQLVSMREMLKHWLKTAVDPPPTWEAVVNALRSPLVNEMSVAAQLELKYCTSVQYMKGESSHPTQIEKSEDSLLSLSMTSELMCSNCSFYALIKGDFRFNGTCEVVC